MLGTAFGLVLVGAPAFAWMFRVPLPIPVAGRVTTCPAAAPIVVHRLHRLGLRGDVVDDGVRFSGKLTGRSAPFFRQVLDVVIASPGRVTASDAAGVPALEATDLGDAGYTVSALSFTLNVAPTAAAHHRLLAAYPAGVPALTWHRDGVRLGTSEAGLPASGESFDIPVSHLDAGVTLPLMYSDVLPCPATFVWADPGGR